MYALQVLHIIGLGLYLAYTFLVLDAATIIGLNILAILLNIFKIAFTNKRVDFKEVTEKCQELKYEEKVENDSLLPSPSLLTPLGQDLSNTIKNGKLCCLKPTIDTTYRGYHYMIDAVFKREIQPSFGHTLFQKLLIIAREHNINVVGKKIKIFDGTNSPKGFASVVLIDESHISAHCYTDIGLIAFDCFTCGADPLKTKKVTEEVFKFLKAQLGDDAKFLISHLPRFPNHSCSNNYSKCV